jgi:hypothetical protein
MIPNKHNRWYAKSDLNLREQRSSNGYQQNQQNRKMRFCKHL